jgi:hypothetical protein
LKVRACAHRVSGYGDKRRISQSAVRVQLAVSSLQILVPREKPWSIMAQREQAPPQRY